MRALRLIGLAAQAEGLILRRQGATMGRTAVLSFAAGAFGITALAMLHVAGWIWFKQEYGAFYAALILFGIDLILMALLLFLARSHKDPVAEEATRLRDQSIALLTNPTASGAGWERLAMEAVGVAAERWLRR